ncbi:hypothetical protein BDQ17DRAFT_1433430 [Cyathus striatus]|nr:hypothetical protein BDQ17DRAFT_1433430 [Cyathus striatus]
MQPAFPQSYTLKSNNNMTQQCTVYIGLVVSGVLDVSKLQDAHEVLVGLWPALGGKIITSTKPFSFTSGTIVDFKSRSLQRKLVDVGLTPFAETSSSHPSFHAINTKSDHLFHFDSLSNFPPPPTLFALRVTTLEDATLLGFRFPHHLFDGQACYDAIHAYVSILSGRSIPQLIPPPDIESLLSESVRGEDKLPPSVRPHPHVDLRSNYTLGFWGFAIYIFMSFFNSLRAALGLEEKDEEKMVHLPAEFVESLRNGCQDELEEDTLEGEMIEGKGLELSKNDVITAWLMKGAYATHRPSDRQGVDISFGFNYRRFLDPLPPNQTYIHNSFYNIRTSFPSLTQFQSLPLWRVALEMRLTCVRNMQPKAVKSGIRFLEATTKTLVTPNPPDRPLGIYYGPILSHWTRFEYLCLDFSEALLDRAEGVKGNEGKVLFMQPVSILPFGLTIKPYALVWKDGQGGYWARVNLLKSWWRGFDAFNIA